jgi:hypothetical protein
LRRSAVVLSVNKFNSPLRAGIIVTIAFVIRRAP